MTLTSAEYFNLVEIYCGMRPVLPNDLCMICLEFAGMCGRGQSCAFYWIFF